MYRYLLPSAFPFLPQGKCVHDGSQEGYGCQAQPAGVMWRGDAYRYFQVTKRRTNKTVKLCILLTCFHVLGGGNLPLFFFFLIRVRCYLCTTPRIDQYHRSLLHKLDLLIGLGRADGFLIGVVYIARVAEWEPYDVHDVAHVPWVGCVRYRPCTIVYHNGSLGSICPRYV